MFSIGPSILVAAADNVNRVQCKIGAPKQKKNVGKTNSECGKNLHNVQWCLHLNLLLLILFKDYNSFNNT